MEKSITNHATYRFSQPLLTAGVFLLSALALLLPSGYSYGAVVLLIGAIAWAIEARTAAPAAPVPGLVRLLVAVMIAYALVWIGDAAWRGEGLREFDRPSRFLFAAFCLVALARSRVRVTALWAGIAVGGIGTGGFAVWQKIFEGAGRASGVMQTILYGNLSMLLGLMSLAGLLWAWHQNRRGGWMTAMGISAVGGITASLLSGTRGAWLAAVVAVGVGLWTAWRLGRARVYLIVAPLALAVMATAAYLAPQTGVAHRVDTATQELKDYFNGTDRRGSVAYRLEMWRGGLILFGQSPVIGHGENGYIAKLRALGDAGVIERPASRFTHAHNDWVNVLAKRGLVGAVILLGLYLVPAAWFWRSGHQAAGASAETLALSTAGLIFCLGFMATGFTQVNFNHNAGAMSYAFMTAVLVGLTRPSTGALRTAPRS
ncbi:O-antigen ligase family protein [Spiribacter sp. 218]|uniref:O-antigen ligase family protein n=1 Tax=Spiribacter pallidus TaxID=1987936 RepID=UPI00349FC7B0